MHGKAGVAKCALREAFWHPQLFGTLRPSVAVTVLIGIRNLNQINADYDYDQD